MLGDSSMLCLLKLELGELSVFCVLKLAHGNVFVLKNALADLDRREGRLVSTPPTSRLTREGRLLAKTEAGPSDKHERVRESS